MITYQHIGKCGRFANQIFQIAGTIAVAERSGQAWAFPEWKNWDAQDRFGTTEDIDVQKYFVNPLPRLPVEIPGYMESFTSLGYFWGYQPLFLSGGNWDLSSIHFQSEKYWKGHENVIRHYMTMHQEPDYLDATALHIRHGDYSGWNEGYHPRCSIDYYRKALECVNNEILVFSDDNPGAAAMMDLIGREYKIIDKGYLESFAIMKKCKNFITANSSYSMAAAYLGDQPGKIITAPAQWFGPSFGGPEDTAAMARDIYPDNCIVL